MEKLVHWVQAAWAVMNAILRRIKANSGLIIAILIVLNLFGVIKPETATAMRDAVLAMAGL